MYKASGALILSLHSPVFTSARAGDHMMILGVGSHFFQLISSSIKTDFCALFGGKGLRKTSHGSEFSSIFQFLFGGQHEIFWPKSDS